MAVVERSGSCELLGTGCGANGRLPGKARGCVEFSALDVKVFFENAIMGIEAQSNLPIEANIYLV